MKKCKGLTVVRILKRGKLGNKDSKTVHKKTNISFVIWRIHIPGFNILSINLQSSTKQNC